MEATGVEKENRLVLGHQNPDRFDSVTLTTTVMSCNLDIHNCTDDIRLLSPSLMAYGALMVCQEKR